MHHYVGFWQIRSHIIVTVSVRAWSGLVGLYFRVGGLVWSGLVCKLGTTQPVVTIVFLV